MNLLPAIAVSISALTTSYFITRFFGEPSSEGRQTPIDGLRGYLALFVYLHHACIWCGYLQSGKWNWPESWLYIHFGISSVSFFFMISGFLFFSKLLNGRTRPIDWDQFFVSRVLRITPLYLFAMGLLFLIVADLSDWTLREPPLILIKSGLRWLAFTIKGEPDLNGLEHTGRIVAGVTWTLRYEWFFYLSLPLLTVLQLKVPWQYLVLGLVSGAILLFEPSRGNTWTCFLAGILSALLARFEAWQKLASRPISTVIVIGCVATSVFYLPPGIGIKCFALQTIAFALIAGGNSLGGVLNHPVSRTLGEISYSVYLLHGIVLFVIFELLLGPYHVTWLSPTEFWFIVVAMTPVLVTVCFATFRWIELPPMRHVVAMTTWLRSRSLKTVEKEIIPTIE